MRRRDCSLESPSSKRGFLTSNIPLEEYLKVYSECDGIRSENRKCSERVCTLGMVSKFALLNFFLNFAHGYLTL